MSESLQDRVILVTGAARGLGLAYARCLIAHGAKVAMHDGGVDQDGHNPDPTIIADAARSIGSENVLPIPGLLNTKQDCAAVLSTAVDHFGRIDGLINNAGVVLWKDTAAVDAEAFSSSSAINHEAAFWLCQGALNHMRAQGYGRIVLTSSTWSLAPYPGSTELTLYAMSKAAQFGLGMALANGTGHPDIKVNVIAPVANTRIYASEVEPGRLEPEAVAGTAAWLVSPQCSINGRVLRVADGQISLIALAEEGSVDLGAQAADPDRCGAAIEQIISQ